MKKKTGCLWFFILVPLLSYILYKLIYPSVSWHQKVTIIVQTPTGTVKGSSVTWTEFSKRPEILPDIGSYKTDFRGEATVVELGDGIYLFALLDGLGTNMWRAVFSKTNSGFSYNNRVTLGRKIAGWRGQEVVPSRYYPTLVTFNDIKDPTSVQAVKPNDLAATFGEGYSLRSITLEITDEPVTEGDVEMVLGWFRPTPEFDEIWKTNKLKTFQKQYLIGLKKPFRE